MKRTRKVNLTSEEWSNVANDLKASLAMMRAMYDMLLTTTTVAKAEVMRRAIKQTQHVWHASEELCARQHGFDFAAGIFHGEGWVYLA